MCHMWNYESSNKIGSSGAKFKSIIYNTYQTLNQSRKAPDHCSTSRSCYLQHPLSCVAFFFFLRLRRQALLRSGTILCLPQACLFVKEKRRRRGRRSERRVGYRILIALDFLDSSLEFPKDMLNKKKTLDITHSKEIWPPFTLKQEPFAHR